MAGWPSLSSLEEDVPVQGEPSAMGWLSATHKAASERELRLDHPIGKKTPSKSPARNAGLFEVFQTNSRERQSWPLAQPSLYQAPLVLGRFWFQDQDHELQVRLMRRAVLHREVADRRGHH